MPDIISTLRSLFISFFSVAVFTFKHNIMLKYMAAIVFIHYAAKSMVFCFYKVTSTTTVAQLYKLPQTR